MRSEPVAGAVRGGVVDDDEVRTLPSPLLSPQGLRQPGSRSTASQVTTTTVTSLVAPDGSLLTGRAPVVVTIARSANRHEPLTYRPCSGSHRMTDARPTRYRLVPLGRGDRGRARHLGPGGRRWGTSSSCWWGSPPRRSDRHRCSTSRSPARPDRREPRLDPLRRVRARRLPGSAGSWRREATSFSTPLAYRDSALVATPLGGPFTTIILPGHPCQWSRSASWLPSQAFAAGWWLPVLLVRLLMHRAGSARFGAGPEVSLPLTLVLAGLPRLRLVVVVPGGHPRVGTRGAVAAATPSTRLRRRGAPVLARLALARGGGLALGPAGPGVPAVVDPPGASILHPDDGRALFTAGPGCGRGSD